MKLKHLYLVLAIVGTALPYATFVPWVLEHGLNISLLASEIFSSQAVIPASAGIISIASLVMSTSPDVFAHFGGAVDWVAKAIFSADDQDASVVDAAGDVNIEIVRC